MLLWAIMPFLWLCLWIVMLGYKPLYVPRVHCGEANLPLDLYALCLRQFHTRHQTESRSEPGYRRYELHGNTLYQHLSLELAPFNRFHTRQRRIFRDLRPTFRRYKGARWLRPHAWSSQKGRDSAWWRWQGERAGTTTRRGDGWW